MRTQHWIFRHPFLGQLLDVAGRSEGVDAVGEGGPERLARAFAVPACALGVGLSVFLLVGLRGPLEGGVERRFWDFIVVVEEFLGFGDRIAVVEFWGELMRVLVYTSVIVR